MVNEQKNIDIYLVDEKQILKLNINFEVPYKTKMELFEKCIYKYSEQEKSEISETKLKLELILTCDKQFNFSPKRLSYADKSKLKKFVNYLIARKVICPSNIKYASPMVLSKKKSSDSRWCVEYRKLNKIRTLFPQRVKKRLFRSCQRPDH